MLDYSKWQGANDANWYIDDPIVTRYAKRYVSEAVMRYVEDAFVETGRLAAGPIDKRAVHTDRDGAPKLIRYNRQGEEINEIWYNEGYLQTVKDGFGSGVVALRYDQKAPEKIPFFVNSILLYLLCEAETGFACPVTLTQSAAFVIEKFGSEEQKQKYLSRLASPKVEDIAQGATFLTEIQGGSDVGATETRAVKQGDHYVLSGQKWFASNCDAEIAITLARINEIPGTRGLGLFLMPKFLPDGSRNPITIRRLKDKLGVRAVASGELVLNQAIGYLIGSEAEGFKYMAEALNVSRIDTALGGLAVARRAYLEAILYAHKRSAFGKRIIDYPMIQETFAALMAEIEAGWAVTAQMIRRFDLVHTYGTGTEEDISVMRILLSLAKYRLSELGVSAARQAMDMLGGNGYIEEYPLARLLRDALVNPIWEGTANIQSLEVLKNLKKGGSQAFIAALQETLAAIDLKELDELRTEVHRHVLRLQELFDKFAQLDSHCQTAGIKKLVHVMYDVFAAVHLLEESQYDVMQEGNGRRIRIIQIWMRLTLNVNSDTEILKPELYSQNEFQAITAFGHIK
ncbi:acyl-CoA dehydrogenase family protein [Paenibacillus aceris]|uniref:Alkylation response protein AidB-like acyl-CoA dehydrogenase n=1 Tax=Paenibacillus aceris TaxID=869555 RepID=A0ABS4I239_9BACL|nr:acyl-CoA dehydrogenase family protein [Paenibacillus aceris]MBP1964491.1 alkylation response protein AidB-like acyl-CoA dehydrogenase [Paenibacillus aceris]NHW35799.1 isovaleryl-CoA dehydrogenase [Paenibacillus aceris]